MSTPVPTQKQTRIGLETVLVAVGPNDGDRIDRLVEEAGDLAGPSGARVVLTHVFSPEEFEARVDELDFDVDAREVSADQLASRHAAIREFARELETRDITVEVRGVVGERGEGISSLAETIDADLVIVGGRKRSPTGKAVFGSIAQEVMLSAPCPVTFVRADTE